MFKDVNIDRSKAVRRDQPIFSGTVYQQPLISADDSGEVTALAVWFENGARTRPHTHATDQLLHVVEGTCVVADQHERRHLGIGGLAFVKAGEWHWHGAAKGMNACHISIRKDGATDINVPEGDWADW